MKTDSILYRIFQELPSTFFELIGKKASEAQAYRFESVELKQTAFRIDGVFSPKSARSKRPVYFGEFQFYKNENLYSTLFAEVFLYLDKNNPGQDWRAVVVYKSSSMEPDELDPYKPLLNSDKVIRIYLNELDWEKKTSIGLGILQLLAIPKSRAAERAKQLLERAQEEIAEEATKLNVLDLIETAVVYKFPDLTWEEIEMMLGLQDLRDTKVYQQALEEGERKGEIKGERKGELKAKLETVPRLLALGLTVEQIAQALGLTVEEVRKVASQQ